MRNIIHAATRDSAVSSNNYMYFTYCIILNVNEIIFLEELVNTKKFRSHALKIIFHDFPLPWEMKSSDVIMTSNRIFCDENIFR